MILSSMSSSDLCSYLKELVTVLGSADDFEGLKKSSEYHDKTEEFFRLRNLNVKRSIEALVKMKEQGAKSLLSRQRESQENEQAILGLESKKSETSAGLETLGSELGSVEEAIRQSELETSNVREEKAGIQKETVDVLPKTKYAFSLYSNITRVRWDYESEGDQLKGFVATLRDVRPFTLNVKENNKFFVANYLWDVIESA